MGKAEGRAESLSVPGESGVARRCEGGAGLCGRRWRSSAFAECFCGAGGGRECSEALGGASHGGGGGSAVPVQVGVRAACGLLFTTGENERLTVLTALNNCVL